MITDSSGRAGSADLFTPRVTYLGERRIGIGQTMTVPIDSTWLAPDPSKALIVLEQGSKRVKLKPEMNFATHGAGLVERFPAILIARVEDDDLTGKVTVRVYNPAKGSETA